MHPKSTDFMCECGKTYPNGFNHHFDVCEAAIKRGKVYTEELQEKASGVMFNRGLTDHINRRNKRPTEWREFQRQNERAFRDMIRFLNK